MLELKPLLPISSVAAPEWYELNPPVVPCSITDPRLRDTASPLQQRGQLLALSRGAASVHGVAVHLLSPAYRFGWIPPGLAHQMVLHGAVEGLVLCMAAELCSAMPSEPVLFAPNRVAAALFENIAIQPLPESLAESQASSRLGVLCNELLSSSMVPLRLPMPVSGQAQRVARAIMLHPGERRSEQQWAEWAGLSRRSLIRHFERSGLSFSEWRRRARAMAAIERLARGVPVAETATEVGYASVSAFIHRFRRMLDTTPGDYLRRP